MSKLKDMVGLKFGKLKVIKRVENTHIGQAQWLCKCDCGNDNYITLGSNLRSGNNKSCGCLKYENTKEINDLTGKTFGRLTVLRLADEMYESGRLAWICKCICGTEKRFRANSLLAGKSKSCGCLQRENCKRLVVNNIKDLSGLKFGRLKVLKMSKNRDNNDKIKWICKCECGVEKEVLSNSLVSGRTLSCGCYNDEMRKERKKFNTYDLDGEYGVGYTTNTNKEFYFDIVDYDKIKDITWHESSDGRIINIPTNESKAIWIHRLIMDCPDNMMIDHISRNPADNRKINLRICTQSENVRNQTISLRNTSGVIGVYQDKKNGYWFSRVTVNYKVINLGYFCNKNDAIKARLEGEIEYYGEFAPQKHLFKEYGINVEFNKLNQEVQL